jgi:hypothetical protein
MNSKKKGGITIKPKTILSLMPADPTLAALEGQRKVLDTIAIVSDLAKKIEPVGEAYAKI